MAGRRGTRKYVFQLQHARLNTHAFPVHAIADAAILQSLLFTHSNEVAARRVQGAVRGGAGGMASPARLLGYAMPVHSSPMAMPSPGRSAPPADSKGGLRNASRKRRPPSLLADDRQLALEPDFSAPFAETQALCLSLGRQGGLSATAHPLRMNAARSRRVLRLVCGKALLWTDELLAVGATCRALRHAALAEVAGVTLQVRYLRAPGAGAAVAAWLPSLGNLRSLALGQCLEMMLPQDSVDLLQGVQGASRSLVALAVGGHVELPQVAHAEAKNTAAQDTLAKSGQLTGTQIFGGTSAFHADVVAALAGTLSTLAPRLRSLAVLPTCSARLTAAALSHVLPPLLAAKRIKSLVWAGLSLPGNMPGSLLSAGPAREIADAAVTLGISAPTGQRWTRKGVQGVEINQGSAVAEAFVLGRLIAPLLKAMGPSLRELDTSLWLPTLRGWYSDRYASLGGSGGSWDGVRAARAIEFAELLAEEGGVGAAFEGGVAREDSGSAGGSTGSALNGQHPSSALWQAMCCATSLQQLNLMLPADRFDAMQAAAVVASSAETLTSLRISAPSHLHIPHGIDAEGDDDALLLSLQKRRGSMALSEVVRMDSPAQRRAKGMAPRRGGASAKSRRGSVAARPAGDEGEAAQVGFDSDPHIPSFVFCVLEPTADAVSSATNPPLIGEGLAAAGTAGGAVALAGGAQRGNGADALPSGGNMGGSIAAQGASKRAGGSRVDAALSRSGLVPAAALDGMSVASDVQVEHGQVFFKGEEIPATRREARGGASPFKRGGDGSSLGNSLLLEDGTTGNGITGNTTVVLSAEEAHVAALGDGDMLALERIAARADALREERAAQEAADAVEAAVRGHRRNVKSRIVTQYRPGDVVVVDLSELSTCGGDLSAELKRQLQTLHLDQATAEEDFAAAAQGGIGGVVVEAGAPGSPRRQKSAAELYADTASQAGPKALHITDGTGAGAAKSIVGGGSPHARSRRSGGAGDKAASTIAGSMFEGASAGAVQDDETEGGEGGVDGPTGVAHWLVSRHLSQLAMSTPTWLLCDAVRMDESYLPVHKGGKGGLKKKSSPGKKARFADEVEEEAPKKRGVAFAVEGGSSDEDEGGATPGADPAGRIHLRPLTATLAWCSNLTDLTLSHVSLADPGSDMQSLAAALETSPLPLAHVTLRHTPLGHAGAAGLAAALTSAGNLRSVHITNCALTDMGASALGYTVGTAVGLTSFELSRDVTVSDSGAGALIAGLVNCRRLNALTLSELKATAGTVSVVGQSLPAWPLLKSLALNGHPAGTHTSDWYDVRTPPVEWTWRGGRSRQFEMAGGVAPPRPEHDVIRGGDAMVVMPEQHPCITNTIMARAGVKALIKGLRHVSPLVRFELRHWGVPGNGMVAILSALRRSCLSLRCLDCTGTALEARGALALAACMHSWKDSLVYCAVTLGSPSAYTLYKYAHRYGQLVGGYPEDHPLVSGADSPRGSRGGSPRSRSRSVAMGQGGMPGLGAKNAEFADALSPRESGIGLWDDVPQGGDGGGQRARRRSVAVATTAATAAKRRTSVAVSSGRAAFVAGGKSGATFGAAPPVKNARSTRKGSTSSRTGSVNAGGRNASGSVGGWSAASGGDDLPASSALRDTADRKPAVQGKTTAKSGGGAVAQEVKPALDTIKSLGDLSPEEAAFALSYSTSHVPEVEPVDAAAVAAAKQQAQEEAEGGGLFGKGGQLPASAQAVLDRKKARAEKGGAGVSKSPKRNRRLTASFKPGTRTASIGSAGRGTPSPRGGRRGTKSWKGGSKESSGGGVLKPSDFADMSDAVSVVSFASFSTHTRGTGSDEEDGPATLGDVAAAVLMGGAAGSRTRKGPEGLTEDHVSMLLSAIGQCAAMGTLSLSFTPHVAPVVVSGALQRVANTVVPSLRRLRKLALWRMGPVPEMVALPEPEDVVRPAGVPADMPMFAAACGGVASPSSVAALLAALKHAPSLVRVGMQVGQMGCPAQTDLSCTQGVDQAAAGSDMMSSTRLSLPAAPSPVPSASGSDTDSTATLDDAGSSDDSLAAPASGANLSELLDAVSQDAAATGGSLQFVYLCDFKSSSEA